MTLLVSWVGIDPHGVKSVYIASDSRTSWGALAKFDLGRKVFAFSNWPDILGYSGDVLFPSIALNQIVELGDSGLLFEQTFSCKQKFQAIVDKLNQLFRNYPQAHSGLAENSLNIIHGSRDTRDNSKFFCHTISWSVQRGWQGKQVNFPDTSGVLFVLGSGAVEFQKAYQKYSTGPTSGTSRAAFHCFCNTLKHVTDPYVGGAPQLVGIYRKPHTSSKSFGVIYEGSRYFLGANVDNLHNLNCVEWRNINF